MTLTTDRNEPQFSQWDTDHLLKKISKLEKQLKKKLTCICPHCEIGTVILTYKKYLNQYNGICDNKGCQIHHSLGLVK